MASLASGVIVPSLVNGNISGSGLVNGMMRHSLNGGHALQGQRPESRLSVQHRRSARGQLTRQDQQRLQEQQRLPEPLIGWYFVGKKFSQFPLTEKLIQKKLSNSAKPQFLNNKIDLL